MTSLEKSLERAVDTFTNRGVVPILAKVGNLAGTIFDCKLDVGFNETGEKRSLCDKASPRAREIVNDEARITLSYHFAQGVETEEHAMAINAGIFYAKNLGKIKERDGHAVAADE